MKLHIILILLLGLWGSVSLYASSPPELEEEVNQEPPSTYRSDCLMARANKDLSINKVRARIMTGGDKWWDLNSSARYVVPTPPPGQPEVSSIFAGALWVGGFDEEGNLKLAGQTYRRENMNDWWPGPLSENGTTDFSQCRDWDVLFSVTNEDVRLQKMNLQQYSQIGMPIPKELIPENILYWPAIGNPFFTDKYDFDLPTSDQGVAPFFDYNNDGIYNPVDGDFPILGIEGCASSENTRIPDEMLFWIFNDAGGIHTNTSGEPTRFEIRVQAFAFDVGNELDYMTFYRYQMVNRGHSNLDSVHIGLWVDFDLGCPLNDYIGSYPDLDLAFAYNIDEYGGINQSCECGTIATYCDHIPAIGVNILSGPKDKNGNNLGLSYFTYNVNNPGFNVPANVGYIHNNAVTNYRFLTGSWSNGNNLTFGGYGVSTGQEKTNYAFPGNPSDPDAWTMCSADSLERMDQRVILSSGPFELNPGGYAEIVYGVPFVLDVDYPCPDLTRLFEVTKKTRTLFDQCFQFEMRGPDAPDMIVSRMNNSFAVELSNDVAGTNNRNMDYLERGTFLPDDVQDEYYVFEGYQVFQLRSPDLPLNQQTFTNPGLARQVFQSDIQNDIDIIYNWTRYENPNHYLAKPIFIPELMVDGANSGINQNFSINRDLFDESGDGKIQAGHDYYYTVIAYAHNEYKRFDWRNPEIGQSTPFLSSSRNVRIYTLNLDNALLPQSEDGRAVFASEDMASGSNWHFNLPGNPGTDYLRLTISGSNEMTFNIRVISMEGRLMYSNHFIGKEYSINSQDWISGVYAVELINLDNVKKTKSLLWVKH